MTMTLCQSLSDLMLYVFSRHNYLVLLFNQLMDAFFFEINILFKMNQNTVFEPMHTRVNNLKQEEEMKN
jgi:hypothetical protein